MAEILLIPFHCPSSGVPDMIVTHRDESRYPLPILGDEGYPTSRIRDVLKALSLPESTTIDRRQQHTLLLGDGESLEVDLWIVAVAGDIRISPDAMDAQSLVYRAISHVEHRLSLAPNHLHDVIQETRDARSTLANFQPRILARRGHQGVGDYIRSRSRDSVN